MLYTCFVLDDLLLLVGGMLELARLIQELSPSSGDSWSKTPPPSSTCSLITDHFGEKASWRTNIIGKPSGRTNKSGSTVANIVTSTGAQIKLTNILDTNMSTTVSVLKWKICHALFASNLHLRFIILYPFSENDCKMLRNELLCDGLWVDTHAENVFLYCHLLPPIRWLDILMVIDMRAIVLFWYILVSQIFKANIALAPSPSISSIVLLMGFLVLFCWCWWGIRTFMLMTITLVITN